MGNKYDKMTEEQRKRWNEYSKNYAREKFISVNLKLVKERDNDMIEFLKNSGVPATTLVKLAVKTLMDSGVDIESLKVEKIEKIEKVKEEKKRGPKAMKLNERNNVRKIRLQHCISQTELAEQLGVTKQALSLCETGKVSVKMATQIADLLEEDLFEVLGLDALTVLPTTPEQRDYLVNVLNNIKFGE